MQPKVLQVVGYQNSGKTTLVTLLINLFSDLGFQVGSVKHHGHKTPLEKVVGDKDSDKHRRAGAQGTLVVSPNELYFTASIEEQSLEKYIEGFRAFGYEQVIVEGFKRESFPKVVMVRREDPVTMIDMFTNVYAVVTETKEQQKLFSQKGYISIFREDRDEIVNWVREQVT
ncbi:molybdopterin-guanine dinucleotide biosynthesis protein B [Texcoconibacillus texcoconensis]|uniref:Molybdopterin-guanine dinucleotide biosynthesis protein B n=1 Tax=Texcoconibacillus texcoconensis TaxID=1095777 RepID=A0A840QSJ5_9BACI|nr:molybdopterin-guanine dinucleotide biosynthesis protein B [Texcoconibacillus texcoconensis]MBB5174320.1 molybdopterin-guanine dinucleotide biosynthesis protein B [Texcoconibacillus texcoconensis]